MTVDDVDRVAAAFDPTLAPWVEVGLSVADADRWCHTTDPVPAALWQWAGVTPTMLSDAADLSFDSASIPWWVAAGFTGQDLLDWQAAAAFVDASVVRLDHPGALRGDRALMSRDAAAWRETGATAAQMADWAARGLLPGDFTPNGHPFDVQRMVTSQWMPAGFDVAEINLWRWLGVADPGQARAWRDALGLRMPPPRGACAAITIDQWIALLTEASNQAEMFNGYPRTAIEAATHTGGFRGWLTEFGLPWRKPPRSVGDVYTANEWYNHGFTPETTFPWAGTRVHADGAAVLRDLGFTGDQVPKSPSIDPVLATIIQWQADRHHDA